MPVAGGFVGVVPLVLQVDQAPGQCQAQQQGQRKFQPIVAVELQLGQEVAGGDAQEEPSFTVPYPCYLSVDSYVLLQSVPHFGSPSTRIDRMPTFRQVGVTTDVA